MQFFLGKPVTLRADLWGGLRKRLKESPYTAFEFCFFVAHRKGLTAAWDRLYWSNHMCSATLWEEFKDWKEKRLEQIRSVVSQQNRAMTCYLNNGFTAEELLLGTRLNMNPLVLLENALRLCHDERLEKAVRDNFILTHTSAAVDLAVGNPEYLHFCPWFRHWAAQQEGERWTALQFQIQRIERTTTP
jgi:hypothetical protein